MKDYYVIRHRVTGNCMPLRKSGRGYTYTEPEEEGIPRLFTSEKGAKASIRWWAEGAYWNDKYGTQQRHVKNNRSPADYQVERVIL